MHCITGRSGGNRTPTSSFGDEKTSIILPAYKVREESLGSCPYGCILGFVAAYRSTHCELHALELGVRLELTKKRFADARLNQFAIPSVGTGLEIRTLGFHFVGVALYR